MTSVWVASATWHLSNDTKPLFTDEFIDKDYSIYTEMLWQTFMCTLPLFVAIKRPTYVSRKRWEQTFLVLEKAFLDI